MYRPFDLAGQVVLITGGGSGIGLAMAEALASAGADLVLWDLDEKKTEAAAEQLARHQRRVGMRRVDVTVEEEVVQGMRSAVAEMGRVDTVIAGAGIFDAACPFKALSLETWRRLNAVNAEGAFLTLREGARHMIQRSKAGDAGGSLVGVGSIAGLVGAAYHHAYGASKGALLALMRSLAVEHAPFGIRANAVVPGWIATDMTRDLQANPDIAGRVTPRIPMRRWGSASDLGGIAVYLASAASAYHTGDMFVIDGGYLIA